MPRQPIVSNTRAMPSPCSCRISACGRQPFPPYVDYHLPHAFKVISSFSSESFSASFFRPCMTVLPTKTYAGSVPFLRFLQILSESAALPLGLCMVCRMMPLGETISPSAGKMVVYGGGGRGRNRAATKDGEPEERTLLPRLNDEEWQKTEVYYKNAGFCRDFCRFLSANQYFCTAIMRAFPCRKCGKVLQKPY